MDDCTRIRLLKIYLEGQDIRHRDQGAVPFGVAP